MSNPLETTVSDSVTNAAAIANTNPLRYRGYVYDSETELYYLQSRYYNPAIGRFINADSLISTGGLLGHNMFAYCGNNPVSRVDPTGSDYNTVTDQSTFYYSDVTHTYGGVRKRYYFLNTPDLSLDFALLEETEQRENATMTAGIITGELTFLSTDYTSITLASFDASLISMDFSTEKVDLSLFDLGNFSASIGIENWLLSVEAMACVWSPSVSFNVWNRVVTVGANLGGIGIAFTPDLDHPTFGYSIGCGFTISLS